jgi:Flp pilus assembly protein TadG
MKKLLKNLFHNKHGSIAVEFALVSPIILTLLFGLFQMGILFYAQAGLNQGINEGARYATIYPAPSDSEIKARVVAKAFGLQSQYIQAPTITRGVSDGVAYVDVSMTYQVPVGFAFASIPAVNIRATRRAFQY